MAQDLSSVLFERHIARLLLVLYYCGSPTNSLFDAETRQVDSTWQLQQFDFWVREPGHLALALLHLPPEQTEPQHESMQAALDRILTGNQADVRRVVLPGAPYNILEDFDFSLSYLTSRALVSDRPSFTRSRTSTHQIVLEAAGIEIVHQILEACPTFEWYRAQCETVVAFFPLLQKIDLAEMSYLFPDLSPALAARKPLIPYIKRRYHEVFGDTIHAVV